ncbi:MAG: selenide, water dikinase SelD [Planctomycetota bacterium]|jgi:selenide,water dikinase
MNVLLLFQSTRDSIQAERLCQQIPVACKVVPVPNNVSSECGMAIRIETADRTKVEKALRDLGIHVDVHCENQEPPFDLLSTAEYGGCSAKLSPDQLTEALKDLPSVDDDRILVGISNHDDAGVYRLTDEVAIIQTTDFFPPICSDPYTFGQIAAANALSDVFAMGGAAVTALNLVMFPREGVPLAVLREILRGGADKVHEAGAVVVGGHTIADEPPKYGLAVTGTVHPNRVITKANAKPGEVLVLTKPLGTGAVIAGQRIGEVRPSDYQAALDAMRLLNQAAAEVMQRFNVRCATDVTGFGLLGHCLETARASGVSLQIKAADVPVLPGAYELVEIGCIPGAAFRNQAFVEKDSHFSQDVGYNRKMLLLDPQTSGGLLMTVPQGIVHSVVEALRQKGYLGSAVIGEVLPYSGRSLVIR